MKRKKTTSDGLFGFEILKPERQPKPDVPHPDLGKLLGLLREGPKHPKQLRRLVDNLDDRIAQLRGQGHKIKSVTFYGQTSWVYVLSENGRYCGVEGDKGRDDYGDTLNYGERDE